jgi:hypothetical protein
MLNGLDMPCYKKSNPVIAVSGLEEESCLIIIKSTRSEWE